MLAGAIKDIQSKLKKINDQILYDPNQKVRAISTGSPFCDKVSGYGGLMVNRRLVEIFGMESCGKTTIALQSCREAQRMGMVGAFIDCEQTYDFTYGQAIGPEVDNKTFTVLQPSTAEETEFIVESLVKSLGDKLDYLVFDSVAACKPKLMLFNDKPGESSNRKMMHAAFWSDFSAKLVAVASKYDIAILLINQIRMKPQLDQNQKFSLANTGLGAGYSFTDNQITTTGGTALRFYLSARYVMAQSSALKENIEDESTGEMIQSKVANWIKIKNIKNKLAPPFKESEFVIRYGEGTDDSSPLYDALKKIGVIKVNGSHIGYTSSDGTMDFKENGSMRFFDQFRRPSIMEDARKQFENNSDKLIKDTGSEHFEITIQDGQTISDDEKEVLEI